MTNDRRRSMSGVLRAPRSTNRHALGMSEVQAAAHRWLTKGKTNFSRHGKRLGLAILGCVFIASLGLAIMVVLVTISLMDLIEYFEDRSFFEIRR